MHSQSTAILPERLPYPTYRGVPATRPSGHDLGLGLTRPGPTRTSTGSPLPSRLPSTSGKEGAPRNIGAHISPPVGLLRTSTCRWGRCAVESAVSRRPRGTPESPVSSTAHFPSDFFFTCPGSEKNPPLSSPSFTPFVLQGQGRSSP